MHGCRQSLHSENIELVAGPQLTDDWAELAQTHQSYPVGKL
jgi:hypothetical protein